MQRRRVIETQGITRVKERAIHQWRAKVLTKSVPLLKCVSSYHLQDLRQVKTCLLISTTDCSLFG